MADPVAGADKPIARAHAPASGDQQAHGEIRDILGQRPKCPGHRQAARAGIFEVDRIGADAVDRHHLERGQLRHHRPGDAGVAAGDDRADRGPMLAQIGILVGLLEQPVHGVERIQLVVDRRDEDRVQLQDAGFHDVVLSGRRCHMSSYDLGRIETRRKSRIRVNTLMNRAKQGKPPTPYLGGRYSMSYDNATPREGSHLKSLVSAANPLPRRP